MYSDKENINILTALLLQHGVGHAVVCPGSRNAPIVHNLEVCPDIVCHALTDERSAGFYALGLAQSTGQPAAVCVTSGTALLNLLPAVAEAQYQHLPLIVISADRPRQWIGQLDGQTLPQAGVLAPFVRHSVTLPEPSNDEERWLCNRLVNEALCLAGHRAPCPVHINVPISEPLFQFTESRLPSTRKFSVTTLECGQSSFRDTLRELDGKCRVIVVMGCTVRSIVDDTLLRSISRSLVLLYEPLMADAAEAVHFDEVLSAISADEDDYRPDFILYLGGTVVSKRLRHFLRRSAAPTWLLTTDGTAIADPTMHLDRVLECRDEAEMRFFLEALGSEFSEISENSELSEQSSFTARWHQALTAAALHADAFEPRYSQLAAVKYFEQQLDDLCLPVHVHYANSTAVRLACIYAGHRVWCNRGVNGIEGSLSTAAGFSLATDALVVCVIGDLSFFYDQNALWNAALRGNLRVILLNNHRGGIFSLLPGLEESPSARTSVSGSHSLSARGICEQCDVGYLSASSMDEMQLGIVSLLTRDARRPMVLEITTDADADAAEMKRYYETFKTR